MGHGTIAHHAAYLVIACRGPLACGRDPLQEGDKVCSRCGILNSVELTRLEVFRALVRHEPDGLPAGEVARRLDVLPSTLSNHLAILSRAGLVQVERRSRSLIYRADLARVRDVLGFLLRDCCNGHAEVCAPLVADLLPSCCTPAGAA